MAPIRECRKSQHKSRLTRPFGLKWANSPSFARSGDARAAGPLPQGLHPLPVHSKRLRDFIDSNHLLIRIDEQLDFAKIAAPLEERNCPDFGRPAVHPEVMVRALLIRSLYNIASFRRLCSAISENICYPWFCFLTSDDPVFDHSTITHFINRIGREGFSEVFDGLNQELLRMGLLSPEMYADSSMVKANVNSYGLSRSGMTVEEFKEQAIEENGLLVLSGTSIGEDGVGREEIGTSRMPRSGCR